MSDLAKGLDPTLLDRLADDVLSSRITPDVAAERLLGEVVKPEPDSRRLG